MCGFCGVAALDGRLDPELRAAVPAMNDALRHRGPDGEGFFNDGIAALGHRRLAIIDRAGGAQPMANEDGTCHVVFNGEIYNHHALRQELISRGHVFRTTSDTEAIVHAYEEFGPACVERLEGMFAFAVYDQRRRDLFIARDRLGKKPLFYAVFGGALHFASEIKALRASPAWNGDLNLSSLKTYLSLGYFLAPATIYRHVRSLGPGEWLRLHNGEVEVRKYWDVTEFDTDGREEPALLAELERLLATAVEERLESEVPLGAFLSGGIDSGLVVAMMSRALGEPPVTTSVGFGDPKHNELEAAAITAGHFHTRHYPELVEPRLEAVLDQVVAALDQPFADSSAIPTYYVSQAARRHVTVALTGDGGDEAFSGYDFRYVPHGLEEQARRFLFRGRAGRNAARQLGAAWPRSAGLPHWLRAGTLLENLGRDPAAAYYADLCFLKPHAAAELLGESGGDPFEGEAYQTVTDTYRRCPSTSAIQRAQFADLKIYLPNDVLVKVDRMSMAHSLEGRCPLLDRKLIEFAFRVPTARKMPRLHAKRLLRSLARTHLPPALANLPKRGFTAPTGAWIRDAYAESFRLDVLSPAASVRSWLDMDRVRTMFDEHRAGRAEHAHALWAIWMLERWSRLDRHSPAAAGPPENRAVMPLEPARGMAGVAARAGAGA